MNIPRESIRKRYFATLISKAFQMMLGAVEASFVPRALGPGAFGSFKFLFASASSIRSGLDLCAQQMVFTASSKSTRSGALTKLYGLWLTAQLLAVLALVGICASTGHINWLWPKQRAEQVLVVTLLEWFMFITARIAQMGDSKGLTVTTQKITAFLSIGTALSLVGLAAWQKLDLRSYVTILFLATALNAAICSAYLFGRYKDELWSDPLQGRVRPYLRQWWSYSSPLVAVTIFSAFTDWLDIYLIQRMYGPKEQGFFALAATIASGVFIFTASSISIYWREIAHSLGNNDRTRAGQIHLMFNRLLFFLTFSLSIWLCFHAGSVITFMGGRAFHASIPILMIMSFYPIQQMHGQMNHAVLLASEHTVHYRNIDIALAIPGLAVSYFLLAPSSARIPGLGLGAIGIALKMVVYGLIAVQLYEFRVCRILNVSYTKLLSQKLFMSLFIGSIAWISLVYLPTFLPFGDLFHGLIRIAIASVVYVTVLGVFIFRWPKLVGLDREHIDSFLGRISFL